MDSTLEFTARAIAMKRRGVPTAEATKLARKWLDISTEALDERDATPKWRFVKRERLATRARAYGGALASLATVYPDVVQS